MCSLTHLLTWSHITHDYTHTHTHMRTHTLLLTHAHTLTHTSLNLDAHRDPLTNGSESEDEESTDSDSDSDAHEAEIESWRRVVAKNAFSHWRSFSKQHHQSEAGQGSECYPTQRELDTGTKKENEAKEGLSVAAVGDDEDHAEHRSATSSRPAPPRSGHELWSMLATLSDSELSDDDDDDDDDCSSSASASASEGENESESVRVGESQRESAHEGEAVGESESMHARVDETYAGERLTANSAGVNVHSVRTSTRFAAQDHTAVRVDSDTLVRAQASSTATQRDVATERIPPPSEQENDMDGRYMFMVTSQVGVSLENIFQPDTQETVARMNFFGGGNDAVLSATTGTQQQLLHQRKAKANTEQKQAQSAHKKEEKEEEEEENTQKQKQAKARESQQLLDSEVLDAAAAILASNHVLTCLPKPAESGTSDEQVRLPVGEPETPWFLEYEPDPTHMHVRCFEDAQAALLKGAVCVCVCVCVA
jgi:hypothetical protein